MPKESPCILQDDTRSLRYQVPTLRLKNRIQLQFYERSNRTELTFLSGGPGRRAPTSLGVGWWCGLSCAPRLLLAAAVTARGPSISVRNLLFDQLRFHLQLWTHVTPELEQCISGGDT